MLSKHIENELVKIAETYPVDQLLLFGSRAHGDEDKRSDIDIAIIAPRLNQKQWLELTEKIEEVPTLLKFDLIRWESATQELKNEISKKNIPLYISHKH
ncbi:nucleotidyltransferase domain-containing protein [Jeotgalibacillus terrae]|uniref:Nucleotidyltransferase domain-containing protein n=1 Tax=Jeotgalibacillus terrae TaxID=587735 RepID=A0ABW5ZDT6_9BACL|nr:nucleotidyltransferase domain-containing protein [Jeotgalibacillus terrae]MBM7577944.1 putative nucleotidyltransferase [Jeotgalibacillus terrae]